LQHLLWEESKREFEEENEQVQSMFSSQAVLDLAVVVFEVMVAVAAAVWLRPRR
jgi:hypothetical protein